MRDPQRIDRMLAIIRRIWNDSPDLRLGQIIATASIDAEDKLFYVEDRQLEGELVEFMRSTTRQEAK